MLATRASNGDEEKDLGYLHCFQGPMLGVILVGNTDEVEILAINSTIVGGIMAVK
jgi:hypothetical protein